ncbi:MAG: hypothetical protein ACOYWZ_20595 [Bacillota bacterium]
MYGGRGLVQDVPVKRLVVYPIILMILIGFSFFFFFQPRGPGYEVRERFYFLIFSCIVFFTGITVKGFVNFFLAGKLADFLGRSLLVFGNGIAAFIFFFLVSESRGLKTASAGIILVAASIIVYRASSIYSNRVFAESVIKIASYVMLGISIKFMFQTLWPEGFWDIGFKISVGDLTLFSFIGISIIQLVSLIDLTGNETAYRISFWLKRNHTGKFFAIFITVFLLKDLRRDIMGDAVLGEWILIFVILVAVFIILAVKLSKAVKNSPEEKLNKHLQNISYDKIKDISNISKHINDFINSGRRSGLVSCLFYMAYKT